MSGRPLQMGLLERKSCLGLSGPNPPLGLVTLRIVAGALWGVRPNPDQQAP